MAKLTMQEMIWQVNEERAKKEAKSKAFEAYMRGPRTPLQRFRDNVRLCLILFAIVAIIVLSGVAAFAAAVAVIRWIIWGGR